MQVICSITILGFKILILMQPTDSVEFLRRLSVAVFLYFSLLVVARLLKKSSDRIAVFISEHLCNFKHEGALHRKYDDCNI